MGSDQSVSSPQSSTSSINVKNSRRDEAMGTSSADKQQDASATGNSNSSSSAATTAAMTSSAGGGSDVNKQTTVRDHINKEIKSRDHKQHALYTLLSTGKATPPLNPIGVSSSASYTTTPSHAASAAGSSSHAVNTSSPAMMAAVSKSSSQAGSERGSTPATSAPAIQANSKSGSEEKPSESSSSSSSSSSAPKIHPKKAFLQRQQQSSASSASLSSTASSSSSVATNEQQPTTKNNNHMTSHSSDAAHSKSLTSHAGRVQPTSGQSSTNSGRSVKSYLEHLIENIHEADNREEKPATSRGKTISQDLMIQQRIRQFLHADDGSAVESSKTTERVASVLTSSYEARRSANNGKSPPNQRELTIAQRIQRDIGAVLQSEEVAVSRDRRELQHASPMTSFLAQQQQQHQQQQQSRNRAGIVVRQSRPEAAAAPSVPGGPEKASHGYKVACHVT